MCSTVADNVSGSIGFQMTLALHFSLGRLSSSSPAVASDGAGKSVVGANAKPVGDPSRDKALRTFRDRLADIGVGAA